MTARSEVDDEYHYIDTAAMVAQQSRFEVELEIKRGGRHLLTGTAAYPSVSSPSPLPSFYGFNHRYLLTSLVTNYFILSILGQWVSFLFVLSGQTFAPHTAAVDGR